jgi:UDP-N-acetylglucosamine 2-epimerase (non-hydrolysing)
MTRPRIRSTTERPITIEQGTNRLVPVRSRAAILAAFEESTTGAFVPRRPQGRDGRAAERIAAAIHARPGID